MELYGVALDRKSVGGACSRHIVALNPFQQHDWLANAAVRQVAPQSSHCPARLQSAFVLASAPPLAPAAPPVALASALSGAGRLVNRRTSDNSREDRKSVEQGKSVSVRVDLGGRRYIKNK